jgi:uracil-DNA glycosylase
VTDASVRRARGPALLRKVAREVVACERCPRLRAHCMQVAAERRRAYRDQTYWGRPVPGFGDPCARLLLVGLAPGAHGSNRTGRMFTGDSSGDFLYAALHRAGLASSPHSVSRDDGLALRGVFITAVARCAPPGNRLTPGEILNCRPYMVRELEALCEARVILALGAVAWAGTAAALEVRGLVTTRRPDFGHGVRWIPSPEAPWVFASYHPSRQNTQTGRLNAGMLDAVLREARNEARVLDFDSDG